MLYQCAAWSCSTETDFAKLFMNFSISNQALDLTALSIPERQINRGAVAATVSPIFCHFFPLQSCSWEWHRKQRVKTLVSELVRYNWLFAITAQTIMRPRSNWFQWSKRHVPLLKQPSAFLCCLIDTFKILQTKCKCTEFSKMHKKKSKSCYLQSTFNQTWPIWFN